MKNKTKINSIHSFIPILGLILLVIFSPCKVRNYIQSELGIPTTEVTNKSQTTVSHCNAEESSDNYITQAKAVNKKIPVTKGNVYSYSLISKNSSKNSTEFFEIRNHSISAIPLYILYQNRKVFS